MVLTNDAIDISASVALEVESAQRVASEGGRQQVGVDAGGVVEGGLEQIGVALIDGVAEVNVVCGVYLQVEGVQAVA